MTLRRKHASGASLRHALSTGLNVVHTVGTPEYPFH